MQSALVAPPTVTLTVNAAGFNLIRGLLGARPHDEVRGLLAELEGQVNDQIAAFNGVPQPQPVASAEGNPGTEAPQA